MGFLTSFAVVLEGMTLAAFAVLLVGGKQKREQGWGVLTILVALAAFVQAIGMALMVRRDATIPIAYTDPLGRHIYTKMMSVSFPAGISTRVGPCVLYRGVSRQYVRLQSHWQR